ncbi:MAG: glutathione S-transferase family protein [Candidatus Binatota bacterium]
MPKELFPRAQVRIWIDFCNSRLQAAGSEVVHGSDPQKAREQLRKHLQTLDRQMNGRDYIAGDYSLADITFIPFFTRQQRYGVAIDDTLPKLKQWVESLLARPAVRSTL